MDKDADIVDVVSALLKSPYMIRDTSGNIIQEKMIFLRDGRIYGSRSDLEVTWDCHGHTIRFLDIHNRVTSTFVINDFSAENQSDHDTVHFTATESRFGNSVTLEPKISTGIELQDRRTSTVRRGHQTRILVMVRTHVFNEKVKSLYDSIRDLTPSVDIVIVADASNERFNMDGIDDKHILWHSKKTFDDLGLSVEVPRLLWWCGDYPIYDAQIKMPNYDYYIMIEYDVHFCDDGVLLKALFDLLRESEKALDFIGLRLRQEAPHDDILVNSSFRKFREVYSCFFPIVVLSKSAAQFLYLNRRIERYEGTVPDDILYCEMFVPTLLRRGGFSCFDLNYYFPDSFVERHMIFPSRFLGLPIAHASGFPDYVKMIHPVYGNVEMFQRMLRRHSHRGWLERVQFLIRTEANKFLSEDDIHGITSELDILLSKAA